MGTNLSELKLFMFCLFLGTWGTGAKAEYRAYRLRIVEAQGGPQASGTSAPSAGSSEILTSLDPIQYRDYFHVSIQQRVELVDHWLCPGRTSPEISICPSPREARKPSATLD